MNRKLSVLSMVIAILALLLIPVFSQVTDSGISPVAERIQGLKTFVNGIVIKDPNTAAIDPNGTAKFKSCQVNGSTVATLDGNSHIADSAIYDKHTNLDANSLTLTNASIDPNGKITGKELNLNSGKLTVDPNGDISSHFDADGTSIFNRATIWGDSDIAYFSHYDCATIYNCALRQNSSGDTYLNAKTSRKLYFTVNSNVSNGLVFIDNSLYFPSVASNPKSFYVDRNSTAGTAGNALTVSAGGCTSGATDKNGGNLYLKSGISTGTGISQIDFYTATAGSTGTADNTPSLKLSLNSNGDLIPGIDNNSYIGENDDDTPFAYKGVILKDTTNGKYYRLEIVNGVVTATDLTD